MKVPITTIIVDLSLSLSLPLVGGLIPLHNSCSFGHVDVVQLLLSYGANPNTQDNWKFSPLHEAAIKGKADVCIGERERERERRKRVFMY